MIDFATWTPNDFFALFLWTFIVAATTYLFINRKEIFDNEETL